MIVGFYTHHRALIADVYGIHSSAIRFYSDSLMPACRSWDPATREKALTYLGFFSFIGPTLSVSQDIAFALPPADNAIHYRGPLVGGFMAAAHIHWQWIFWLLTILVRVRTRSQLQAF